MNKQTINYENYPLTTPLLENIVWLGVYLLGYTIFFLFNIWAALTYLGYSLVCMYMLIPGFVCTHCSYYGKTCHSGQGRISALLFSKRDTNLFSSYFKYMRFAAPVFLAPLIAGIILLFFHFSLKLVMLTTAFGIMVYKGCHPQTWLSSL